MLRISACSSSVSSSSASSDKTQVPAHLSIAEFFCSANPFQSSEKTFAPNDLAISTVRSLEPESTTTISSANRTLASVRARLSASLSVMIATESVDRGMPCLFYLPVPRHPSKKNPAQAKTGSLPPSLLPHRWYWPPLFLTLQLHMARYLPGSLA